MVRIGKTAANHNKHYIIGCEHVLKLCSLWLWFTVIYRHFTQSHDPYIDMKTMPLYRCLNQWSDPVLNVLKWSPNAPIFALNAKQIQIIKTPHDFFDTIKVKFHSICGSFETNCWLFLYLKSLSLNCKQRITLSSLYIGTGRLEKDFVIHY